MERASQKIKIVLKVPGNKKLPFTQQNGVVEVNVSPFTMHTAIVFEY